MNNTYLSHNNIVSSLGFDSETVTLNISNEVSGLIKTEDANLMSSPFYTSLVNTKELNESFNELNSGGSFTKLEQMMITSLSQVIKKANIPLDEKVGLLISTTKGNIDALDTNSPFSENRAYLSELGKVISNFFSFTNPAVIVSNACVSGVLAISIAKRFISQKKYDHVFIVSGDIVSPFILSGFNSFQALSDEPCRPYSKNRKGINIGEVAASIFVTSKASDLANESVTVLGEGSCNDANHISGPSRTGEGLYRSITSAMEEACIDSNTIDYISAHGTATMFNDEMESIAFNRHGLSNVPMNSLKGYFGHTLGASGLLETIIGMHSLHNNTLYKSLGFDELGVSQKLNVIQQTVKADLQVFLKTASGFGGCNTAAIFKKVY